MELWDAVVSAGPSANNLQLAPDHTNTSSLNFYRLDALPDTQPTVSSSERYIWKNIHSNNDKIIIAMRVVTEELQLHYL